MADTTVIERPQGKRDLRSYALVTGILTWAIVVLLPRLYRFAEASVTDWALALLPLPLLLLGLWLQGRAGRAGKTGAAEMLLLAAVPLSIAVSLSRFEHGLALRTYSPILLVFSSLSLAAYGGFVSALCADQAPMRPTQVRPLGEVPEVDPQLRRRRIGLAVLGGFALAMLMMVPFATWASPADYREAWGASAPAGATLTALVAGLVGAVGVAGVVAPALRANRERPPSPSTVNKRVAWLATVAVSGMVVYAMLHYGN